MRLQIQPELCFDAEVNSQARGGVGGVGGDSAFARDNLTNAALRYADFFRQAVLGHAQRLEKFLQQYLTRNAEWNLTF